MNNKFIHIIININNTLFKINHIITKRRILKQLVILLMDCKNFFTKKTVHN